MVTASILYIIKQTCPATCKRHREAVAIMLFIATVSHNEICLWRHRHMEFKYLIITETLTSSPPLCKARGPAWLSGRVLDL